MSYQYSDIKQDLQGILHSTNIDDVTNLDNLVVRAGRAVLRKLDPSETKRISQVTLYDGVIDYASPSDLKEKKVISIRPQVDRSVRDTFAQYVGDEFDYLKETEDGIFAVQDNGTTKTLRIKKSLSPASKVINSLSDTTDSGTWTATSPASGLTEDTQEYLYGGASLRFNLTGTAGYLDGTGLDSVDLTDWDEIGSLFLYVYLPSTSFLTSINLRWGNDSSNFWSRTVTAPHLGSFKTGWNLVRFDWSGATETGTVSPSAIDYARITFNTNGSSVSGLRVNRLFISLGKVWDIEYYSKFIFATSAGVAQATLSLDSDIVLLDESSYNIFLYELALLAAQQIQGADSASDVQFYRQELHGGPNSIGMYQRYMADNPNEYVRPNNSWYRIR